MNGELPDSDDGENATLAPTVLVAANSFWNIANFRAGLIDALVRQGCRVIITAPGHDPSWATARGAESVGMKMDRSGLNPAKDFLLLLNYHRLIRKYRPKYFLGFTAKPNIYGSLAARLAGVTSLPNVSGLGTAFINPGLLSALVGLLYRIAFRASPVVFFQNEDDRDLFIRRKIVRRDQARLLPGSGVNLDYFAPTFASGKGIRFLFVGRLLGDKGIREFVEAARLLRPEYPQWRFQVLGPIDERNRSTIERSELEGWIADGLVDYLGELRDVRPIIAGSTAVVLPSYREGLPRSLLEAAAMARPLIATNVPGNRQLVRQGVNGLLCEARDTLSLAYAMRKMGEMSSDERAALGRSAREMVERDYGERLVVRSYLDALEQPAAAAGVH